MGTWAAGPFDSDHALDAKGCLLASGNLSMVREPVAWVIDNPTGDIDVGTAVLMNHRR